MSYLSPSEIEQIFHGEIRNLGKLPIEQLDWLSSLTEEGDVEAADPETERKNALWVGLLNAALNNLTVLRSFRAQVPAEDWQKLCGRNTGLAQLLHALEDLEACGAIVEDPPEPLGRKRVDYDHRIALQIAVSVRDALRGSEPPKPSSQQDTEATRRRGTTWKDKTISLDSSFGPVARVGAKIMAQCTGRTAIPSATFSTWVREGLAANEKPTGKSPKNI